MDPKERQSLDAISAQNSADVTEHDALWADWEQAAEALFRANTMGDLSTPEMIAEREEAVRVAKWQLLAWEKENNWNAGVRTPYPPIP